MLTFLVVICQSWRFNSTQGKAGRQYLMQSWRRITSMHERMLQQRRPCMQSLSVRMSETIGGHFCAGEACDVAGAVAAHGSGL